MKILVIPDVHLKPWMFKEADEIMQEYHPDNVLSLGDIPDDFKCKNNSTLYDETFDAAEAFLEKYPDSLWCIGNHDISYVWGDDYWQSGKAYHAKKTATGRINRFYNKILYSNKPERLKYVFRIDNIIFSHAGLTRYYAEFLQKRIDSPDTDWSDVDSIIDLINSGKISKDLIWNDRSIIWARPQGVFRWGEAADMIGADKYIQVVGHTPMKNITHEGNNGELISCDVFSTDRDRKPIGLREYLMINTVTGFWQGVVPDSRKEGRSIG